MTLAARLACAFALVAVVATAAAAPAPEMVFDDRTIELAGDHLDAVLRGLVAAQAASDGRAALVARQAAAQARADSIRAAHGPEIDAAQRPHDAAVRELAAGYANVVSRHRAELDARVQADAALRQQMDIFAMERAQAQVKGDTTEARRLSDMLAAMVAPTRAESLAVQAKVGPVPPEHPLAAELAALARQGDAAVAAARAMDARALSEGARASGLEPDVFARARERVVRFLARPGGAADPGEFSADERTALLARRAELAAALAPR